ncbi:linear amide C-N hydrolase [Brucella gallinifaecis]|uniref:Choloylglycine hydrolase family protein n=1 Tax=Brucella gallinifaecis TaxID=215590 RepID=A0A502BRX7_9HYPH|nr:choloylglycine hydrolase family protein [Brucella gallinifaecis]TPF76597.1 choloylglycine hydrolase family protein [Brucella gallinifaecis]
MQEKLSGYKLTIRGLVRGLGATMLALGLIAPQAAIACTSFVLPTSDGSRVYGRTMEFAYPINSEMIVLPRNYSFKADMPEGQSGKAWESKYAAVGMNAFGVTALADGMNEKGLTGGVLYFPGFAGYAEPGTGKSDDSLAPWDFLTWALTNFATVAEVKAALDNVSVVGVQQKDMGIVPPLHYTLHDATGASIVIEPVDGKLTVHDNPLGVMTNAPSFDWHMTNLRNYVKLSPQNVKPVKILGTEVSPLGGGSGMLGIPGDTTPPSRFIRASAFVLSAQPVASGVESVRLAEHIVNNFDIPKGWIDAPGMPLEYTQWSTIGDIKNQAYYIKTYDDPVLRGVEFKNLDLDAKDVKIIKMQPKLEPQPLDVAQ